MLSLRSILREFPSLLEFTVLPSVYKKWCIIVLCNNVLNKYNLEKLSFEPLVSITWSLFVPLPAKYVYIHLCRAEKMTINFVWPCSKLRPPNLFADNLSCWHCLSIIDPKYNPISCTALCLSLCLCQEREGKEKPMLRATWDFCNMDVIFIALTIVPSGYAGISLTNVQSGDTDIQQDQTKVHKSK